MSWSVALLLLGTAATCERQKDSEECFYLGSGVFECHDLDGDNATTGYRGMVNHFTYKDFRLRRFQFHVRVNLAHKDLSGGDITVVAPEKLSVENADKALERWWYASQALTSNVNGIVEWVVVVLVPKRLERNTIEDWQHFASVLRFDTNTKLLRRTVLNAEQNKGGRKAAIVGYLPDKDTLVFCGGRDERNNPNYSCINYNRSMPELRFANPSLSHVVGNEVGLTDVLMGGGGCFRGYIHDYVQQLEAGPCRSVVAQNELHILCVDTHFVVSVPVDKSRTGRVSLRVYELAWQRPIRIMFSTAAHGQFIFVCGGATSSTSSKNHTPGDAMIPTKSCVMHDKELPLEKWQFIAPLNHARVKAQLLVIGNVGLLAIGGNSDIGKKGQPIKSVEFLPFAAMERWIELKGDLDVATGDHTLFWQENFNETAPLPNSNFSICQLPIVRYLSHEEEFKQFFQEDALDRTEEEETRKQKNEEEAKQLEAEKTEAREGKQNNKKAEDEKAKKLKQQNTKEDQAVSKKEEEESNGVSFDELIDELSVAVLQRRLQMAEEFRLAMEEENERADDEIRSTTAYHQDPDTGFIVWNIIDYLNYYTGVGFLASTVLTVYDWLVPIWDGYVSMDVVFLWEWFVYGSLWAIVFWTLWLAIGNRLVQFVLNIRERHQVIADQERRRRGHRRRAQQQHQQQQLGNNNDDQETMATKVLNACEWMFSGVMFVAWLPIRPFAFVVNKVTEMLQRVLDWILVLIIRADVRGHDGDNAQHPGPQQNQQQNNDVGETATVAQAHTIDDFADVVQGGVLLYINEEYAEANNCFDHTESMRLAAPEMFASLDTQRDVLPYLYTCASVMLRSDHLNQVSQAILRLITEIERILDNSHGNVRFPMLHLLRAQRALTVKSYAQAENYATEGLDDIRSVHAANFVSVIPVVKYPFSTNLPRDKKIIPESKKEELEKKLESVRVWASKLKGRRERQE